MSNAGIPLRIIQEISGHRTLDERFQFSSEENLRINDTEFITNSYSKNYAAPGFMPVWKGVQFWVGEPHFQTAIPKVNEDMVYGLGWAIDSLGMQQKHRIAILAISNNQARLLNV